MDTVNVNWRKSTKSGGNGGECVEVADTARQVLVRDAKNRNRHHETVLRFSPAAWASFTRALR